MNTQSEPLFDAFLNQHDEEAWSEVVSALLPSIHPVDKTATQIWFRFFPLSLHQAMQQAENPGELAKRLLLAGRNELKDQINSSHAFFYGHRYWPQVKKAVEGFAEDSRPPESLELAAQIINVARDVSLRVKVHESFLIGITAVAFMTLQQVGMDAFRAAPGAVQIGPRHLKRKPGKILKARARDDSQGLFGFLRGEAKEYTVTFNENDKGAKFKLISSQQITTAAANDRGTINRSIPAVFPMKVQSRSSAVPRPVDHAGSESSRGRKNSLRSVPGNQNRSENSDTLIAMSRSPSSAWPARPRLTAQCPL